MHLEIRAATSEDRGFIQDLGERTVMDSVSAMRRPHPPDVIRNFDRLLSIVNRRDHVALIAVADAVRVGFLLLLDSLPDEVTGEDQGFIAYMAVERALRGAGIGAALLARAEDEARGRGLPYMALMVTEENAAARALYERAGYLTERRLLCKML
ncbi:MAG TPA: GNAT family N-acetyltransferase [Candidatus Baltobacteraceae bacterium]|nr:GNAT family N-acetyltransferase [Candidatus Baltobacteraceae bacterium]